MRQRKQKRDASAKYAALNYNMIIIITVNWENITVPNVILQDQNWITLSPMCIWTEVFLYAWKADNSALKVMDFIMYIISLPLMRQQEPQVFIWNGLTKYCANIKRKTDVWNCLILAEDMWF